MRKTAFLVLTMISTISSCQQSTPSDNLTKLTGEQYIEKVLSGYQPNFDSIAILTENSDTLTPEELQSLPNPDELFQDLYVNKNNDIRKVVVRPITEADKALLDTINQQMQAKMLEERIGPADFDLIDIDCATLSAQLDSIRTLDQNMRNGERFYDPGVDRSNLIFVVSALETCLAKDDTGLAPDVYNTIWLVVQHSPYDRYMERYIERFTVWADRGDLSKSRVALMTDRILMNKGEPQIYGSQIVSKNGGTRVVYDLRDPEYVDYRRAQMGMGPLQEYAQRFGVEFTVPQKNK